MPQSPLVPFRRLAPRLGGGGGRGLGWCLGGVVSLAAFGGTFAVTSGSAQAAESASAEGTAAEISKLQAEVARLAQEQREQRALIFRLMQADQQRYDLLIKFLNSGGLSGVAAPPLPGTLPSAPAEKAPAPAPASREASAPAESAREAHSGKVTGRVRFEGSLGEAYVYLEGLRTPIKGGAPILEIRQKNKQFQPRVSVVPLGAKVLFPNEDAVVHNVFSVTPEQSFDLGTIKMGDKSAPVVMTKAGPLEVFCNIHSKMQADILVVPNGHWAKVAADGTFEIPDVPLGARKFVLWGPSVHTATERVDVTPKGATLTFSTGKGAAKPHLNKLGQAYGSYGE